MSLGVLAILELEKKFKRVLYIDLDIHHGRLILQLFVNKYNISYHFKVMESKMLSLTVVKS